MRNRLIFAFSELPDRQLQNIRRAVGSFAPQPSLFFKAENHLTESP